MQIYAFYAFSPNFTHVFSVSPTLKMRRVKKNFFLLPSVFEQFAEEPLLLLLLRCCFLRRFRLSLCLFLDDVG